MIWILQREYANSPEARALLKTAMLGADRVVRVGIDDLDELPNVHPIDVPVGSVEFVRAYADRVGVMLPAPLDYPDDLRPYLARTIRRAPLSKAPRGDFVKPVKTKRFSAIQNYDPAFPPDRVPSDTMCWVSDPIEFGAEYRFYVLHGEALGWAQYDEGREYGISQYDLTRVDSMILAWRAQPRAWALDVGRLAGGHLAVVEVNDAWATGLYAGALQVREYAEWLQTRWDEIQQFHMGETEQCTL